MFSWIFFNSCQCFEVLNSKDSENTILLVCHVHGIHFGKVLFSVVVGPRLLTLRFRFLRKVKKFFDSFTSARNLYLPISLKVLECILVGSLLRCSLLFEQSASAKFHPCQEQGSSIFKVYCCSSIVNSVEVFLVV